MIQKIQQQTGFSLLEVLVAFTILALSLGVIFKIYGTGLQATILSEEYSRAVIIAQSKLATIGIEERSSLGDLTGTEDDKYQWLIKIRSLENDNIELESHFRIVKREVEVSVSWDSLGEMRSITLNTIKIIPIT